MSNIESERYTQLPLPLPESKPNQFNSEPASDPSTVFMPDTGEEGDVTEEYKGVVDEDQEGSVLESEPEKPVENTKNNKQESGTSWVYDSQRRGAQAYAARSRSNPADND